MLHEAFKCFFVPRLAGDSLFGLDRPARDERVACRRHAQPAKVSAAAALRCCSLAGQGGGCERDVHRAGLAAGLVRPFFACCAERLLLCVLRLAVQLRPCTSVGRRLSVYAARARRLAYKASTQSASARCTH
eukprot:4790095-Pleurochrysis_carterae.AAC.1